MHSYIDLVRSTHCCPAHTGDTNIVLILASDGTVTVIHHRYPLPHGRGSASRGSDGRGSDVAHSLFVSQRNGGINAGDSEGGNKSRDGGDAE